MRRLSVDLYECPKYGNVVAGLCDKETGEEILPFYFDLGDDGLIPIGNEENEDLNLAFLLANAEEAMQILAKLFEGGHLPEFTKHQVARLLARVALRNNEDGEF